MKKNLLLLLGFAFTISVTAINRKNDAHAEKLPIYGNQIKIDTEKSTFQLKTKSSVSPAKISSASNAKPGVSYRLPQGTLFIGLSNDYYQLGDTYGYASPYSTWTFANTSTSSPVFNWTLNEYNIESDTYIPTNNSSSITNNNLSVDVTNEGFEFPILKGTANSEDSIFVFGKNYEQKGKSGFLGAGGDSYYTKDRTFNFSNWLSDLGMVTWRFADNDYTFGTGTKGIDAVVAYYEKPQSMLYFEGANFFLGKFAAPTGTTFTLRVITVDVKDGELIMKDTVATSYLLSEDVLVNGTSAFTMPFNTLLAIDEDGLESEIPYLELDDAFVLELSWINKTGVSLGVMSTYFDGKLDTPLPYYNNKAYIYAPYASNGNKRTLLQYSWGATLNTSLKNAAYTYLISETNTITAFPTGNTEVVTLVPYYGKVWLKDNEIPSWIKYSETEHYESGKWGTDFALTFEALPEGIEGRSTNLVFYTWGAKKKVYIKQGVVSAIKNVNTADLKVFSTQNGFNLSYPLEFKTVSIFNITGQLIGDYQLSTTGKSEINVNIKKGSYILKFVGKNTETLKVIK